jgi:hypothetical protein
MRRNAACIVMSFALSGCSGLDPTKLLPTSATQLQTALGQTSSLEQQLIAELQIENDALSYMSRGEYSCGDPRDPIQKAFLRTKDPAQFVKQEKVNQAWQSSIVFIAAYVKELNRIVGQNKAELENITNLTTIAAFVGSNVPGFPAGTAAAATAFQKAMTDAVNFGSVQALQSAALRMERPLEAAVNEIKKYYPVFKGNEAIAFSKWDSCAREKLRFIRDNPMGLIPKYPHYFATAAGTDLDAAYTTYRAKREQFRSVPPVADILKKILDENKKLYDPDVTLSSVASAAQSAATILNDGKSAIQSGESLINPPVATKSAGK